MLSGSGLCCIFASSKPLNEELANVCRQVSCMWTVGDCCYLLVTKAITMRFSEQHSTLLSNQFHLQTSNYLPTCRGTHIFPSKLLSLHWLVWLLLWQPISHQLPSSSSSHLLTEALDRTIAIRKKKQKNIYIYIYVHDADLLFITNLSTRK